ncbi:hypothetical protein NPA08_01985 [Mycoplasmopsis citelli]|uniref:hypothetical protein n=1 Tax=Mycoplasmopsis citelli TaxID=171281 RepID=UPI00211425AE|nr:hypothetical protein [Mycoplasmopsis citelli]UUD36581.1 hypothetical protein NPA08_01985 [Mycoplasmopsis citelli]
MITKKELKIPKGFKWHKPLVLFNEETKIYFLDTYNIKNTRKQFLYEKEIYDYQLKKQVWVDTKHIKIISNSDFNELFKKDEYLKVDELNIEDYETLSDVFNQTQSNNSKNRDNQQQFQENGSPEDNPLKWRLQALLLLFVYKDDAYYLNLFVERIPKPDGSIGIWIDTLNIMTMNKKDFIFTTKGEFETFKSLKWKLIDVKKAFKGIYRSHFENLSLKKTFQKVFYNPKIKKCTSKIIVTDYDDADAPYLEEPLRTQYLNNLSDKLKIMINKTDEELRKYQKDPFND